ncbi:hypothetical protein P7K49_000987 [Saguinus oedipus]|uniref:Uncharacterized protein n=1 Tax=Saguinus oedipus TaxID=9490 RepID=A0ABQ9WE75_SAGOE|nr:hypothetical protein P7K49_000987 [Saguinus oedipus]
MFSESALLGSNLGNATMPGEGSLHQIREALHLQDVGQARAALQKPTTSQQKPQSRAMAGPCHLIQDDIPSSQCQPKCVSPSCTGGFPRSVRGGLPRSCRSLDSSVLVAGARSPAYPRLSWSEWSVFGLVHCGRGIANRFTAGRYRRSELRRGCSCMARCAGHRPAALPGLSGAPASC